MNLHILKGNVGKDPDVKHTENNTVANFTLATDASYTGKDGNRVNASDWHNIVVWGKLAEVVEKHVHKGDQLLLEGSVKTRSYEKDGVTKYTTETRVIKLEFCGAKKSDSGPKIEDIPSMPEPPAEANDLPF